MRNDTILGKIFLNVYLVESIFISRFGKNNVMLVSILNFFFYSKDKEGENSKLVMYLIRVKVVKDVDEFFI